MRKFITTVLGLSLLLVLFALGAWGLWILVSWFLALPTERMTPIAALTGVVLVPIITYFTSRGLERRRTRETAIREKKTELYDQMMRGLMKLLNLGKSSEMTEAEMLAFFADLTPSLISYGSPGVIRAWVDFRQASAAHADDTRRLLLSFEGLLKAMRKDLGHTVFTHSQGELLRIFLNDVDDVLKASIPK